MTSILEQLVAEIQQKHTVGPSGVHSSPNVHGPNSLFGVAGLERDVISTRVVGEGLAAVLPVSPSITDYPMFPYITGKTAAVGTQPATSCLPAPTAGHLKTCLQTAQFGLYQFKTRELEVNTIGHLINAGERVDLRFVNDPLAEQMGRIYFNIPDRAAALRAGQELLMRFVEVGMDFEELLSQQLYIGTGTANEMLGLEGLVTETHYDAKTNILCPSLASDVRDFGDVDITTAAGAAALVTQLVDMYRRMDYRATTMRFGTVRFVFVMRPQVFTSIADIWPCAFMTSGCATASTSAPVIVNSDEQIRMRVDMQANKFLLIDGIRVPVVTDAWMADTDLGNNLFSSDIYLLPLTIRGGELALYWEHFDYSQAVSQVMNVGHVSTLWTDGGRYLTTRLPNVGFCEMWQTKIQPRIILRTPQLAGRLMNVGTTLQTHWRDSATSSIYNVDGGVGGPNSPYGYPVPTLYDNTGNLIS